MKKVNATLPVCSFSFLFYFFILLVPTVRWLPGISTLFFFKKGSSASGY